jgi:hypothetical protein
MSYDDIKKAIPRNEAINFKTTEKEKQDIHEFCEKNGFRVSAFCRVAIADAIRNFENKK